MLQDPPNSLPASPSVAQQQDDFAQALSDRYEILSEVGRGGFATVYMARDRRHGARVAIKVLRNELAAAVAGMRFTREMQIAANLQHPHVLPLLDSGEANGVPYYVMPFVEGESLAKRIAREGPLPIDEAVRLVAEVADGLQYAHAQGFVHRDIKPENILLSQGHAVIADFGVAHALDVTGPERITDSGMALGTVTYMSPEQASGARVDARADLYALACVLYEALTGAPPFSGPTAQAVMARHAVDPPPSIRTVRPTVPEALESAILRGMAKVPIDRHASAGDFRADILRAATTPVLSTRSPRALGNHRRNVTMAAAALALVAAFAVWATTGGGDAALDPNRVVVFPLIIPQEWRGARSTGEDVATLIGSAVDGAGPLRWIDGWPHLSASSRADIRAMTEEEGSAIAREQRSAYVVRGRIAARGDSTDVFLELYDVRGDSVIAVPRATAATEEAWKAGLQATTQLLPRLIRTGVPDVVSEWVERSPTAVAHFLLGESAFRRLQLDSAERAFTAAVRTDSTFGLAAIRGAQAATWNHHAQGASTLITAALRSRLSPRHREFATGYLHFLRGRADSAIAHLDAALRMDSSSAFVWLQLGEVYAHLLPVAGNTDSLGAIALEHAFRLDSTATNPLLHLIEVRQRQGDTTRAAQLVRRFLAASSDSVLSRQVQISQSCLERGPARIEWRTLAARTPQPLFASAAALTPGGRQWQCAAPGLEAILTVDTAVTPDASGRRWASLVLLHAIRLAQQREADAQRLVDARIARENVGSSLFLLSSWATGAFREKGDSVARNHAQQFGADFLRCDLGYRCWLYALRMLRDGRADAAMPLADRVLLIAGPRPTAEDSVLARSIRAHATLARGDTTRAMQSFTALLASGRTGMEWDEAMSLAAERITLGRILVAKRQWQRAIDVLDVFDSKSLVHPLFLTASLELRSQAAESLGSPSAVRAYRDRLTVMRRG